VSPDTNPDEAMTSGMAAAHDEPGFVLRKMLLAHVLDPLRWSIGRPHANSGEASLQPILGAVSPTHLALVSISSAALTEDQAGKSRKRLPDSRVKRHPAVPAHFAAKTATALCGVSRRPIGTNCNLMGGATAETLSN